MTKFRYISSVMWEWITSTGLEMALLLVLALLVPRVGRFALWYLNRNIEKAAEEDPDAAEEGKTQRALVGVLVYIAQLVAYFILILFFLQAVGFSLAGAAIPATVVSAAIGFGAQSIIADFLAGFFILTEKQFGVGDWVRFEGNGVIVEGTVIQVTMRATRIRTLAQETVIIPNSTARVCINASNYWSRAVVVIPVPLLGSGDSAEVIARSEAATRRALARPDIAKELLGELDVQPGVSIQPPSVVGMPWMINMRFMIQVTAGNHWLVERAIRTEILDEFWDEYGSATTVSGEFRDSLITAPAERPQDTNRAFRSDPLIDVAYDRPRSPATTTEPVETAPAPGENPPESPPVPAELADEQGRDPARTPGELMESPETTATSVMAAEEATLSEPIELEPVEDHSRWRRISTAGGRVRASTTALILILLALVFFRLLLIEPSEQWLENNPPATAETSNQGTTEQRESTPASPSNRETTEPTPTESAEQTLTTDPQTNTATPTSTPGQQEGVTQSTGQSEVEPEQLQDPAQTGTPTTPQQQTQQAPTGQLQSPQDGGQGTVAEDSVSTF
ncbi:mechanosensitive ion channel domain-containing protein [Corynebacterium sp. A21]|uniref:mechanosensitive ion channel domain-containing protein n=1 Tax=Corynebacterium sp. A21 TaxID=3457318 RepID=UPI003FCF5970